MTNLLRMFFSGAFESECDKQGRILIPKSLLEYAKLQKEVMIIGISKRIEIWDKQSWQSFIQESLENYESIAEEIDFAF